MSSPSAIHLMEESFSEGGKKNLLFKNEREERLQRHESMSMQENEKVTGVHTRAHMYPSSLNILLQLSEWLDELTKVD